MKYLKEQGLAQKNSQATEGRLFFSLENQLLHLEISDNGVGFPKNKRSIETSLYNKQKRMKNIAGSLTPPATKQATCLRFMATIGL